ncbi:MAG: ribbon-helix-helix protein, CopG family [Candidatus Bathyarchaeota archaeon]|nr:MAG: ribbon-helix-helix protein, CopG family [Candidatus Bathyarchaeota archaeon]
MKLITLNIPENYLKYLDELVDGNYYPNRAEAIRIAVRDMLISEVWERRRMNEEIEIRVE